MIFEGAPLPDDAIPVLLTYLARNFTSSLPATRGSRHAGGSAARSVLS